MVPLESHAGGHPAQTFPIFVVGGGGFSSLFTYNFLFSYNFFFLFSSVVFIKKPPEALGDAKPAFRCSIFPQESLDWTSIFPVVSYPHIYT